MAKRRRRISPGEQRSIDRVVAFYGTLENGRSFSGDDRVDFLELLTGWPRWKAAKFCGPIPVDAACDEDVARALAFFLVLHAGHCSNLGEIGMLAYLTGWTEEYAEHAIALAEAAGLLRDKPADL